MVPAKLLNRQLIVQLQGRSLAEYAVFMTICGVGAALLAAAVVTLANTGLRMSERLELAALVSVWLAGMFYLWLHFRIAARLAQLTPSSTALFHTIQYVAVGMAGCSFFLSQRLGWTIFIVIVFGVEVALGAFFLCYIFLAATLCRRMPLGSVFGFAGALAGIYYSYQHVLTLGM